MKLAIVIGHEPSSPGAYSNYLGMSEYLYNAEVATYMAEIADIYKRPIRGGYKTQMRMLADQINKKDYDLVLELHFNAFDRKANGCEMLIWEGNRYSQLIGERLCRAISTHYRTQNRGVKQINSENQRGYWFLKYMKAPAIIAEPFFGDHEESEKFKHPGIYAEILKKTLCG